MNQMCIRCYAAYSVVLNVVLDEVFPIPNLILDYMCRQRLNIGRLITVSLGTALLGLHAVMLRLQDAMTEQSLTAADLQLLQRFHCCCQSSNYYKSCFCRIRSFRQIRSSMDRSVAVCVGSTLVSSQFDYANSVLFGYPQKHTAHFQRAQHALSRVMTQQRSGSSSPTSTGLLKLLHWLPIEWCIRFKLSILTFKTLHTCHPPYLADLLQYHKTTKST